MMAKAVYGQTLSNKYEGCYWVTEGGKGILIPPSALFLWIGFLMGEGHGKGDFGLGTYL
jgi:hypothetical protein